MKTRAPQLRVLLDNRGFQSVLAGTHCGGVAARAATNHNQIVCHVTPFYMARLYTLITEMARISLVLLLFATIVAAQAPNPSRDFPIDSITIEGNRIPAEAIVEASGMKRGGTGNGAIFDA